MTPLHPGHPDKCAFTNLLPLLLRSIFQHGHIKNLEFSTWKAQSVSCGHSEVMYLWSKPTSLKHEVCYYFHILVQNIGLSIIITQGYWFVWPRNLLRSVLNSMGALQGTSEPCAHLNPIREAKISVRVDRRRTHWKKEDWVRGFLTSGIAWRSQKSKYLVLKCFLGYTVISETPQLTTFAQNAHKSIETASYSTRLQRLCRELNALQAHI